MVVVMVAQLQVVVMKLLMLPPPPLPPPKVVLNVAAPPMSDRHRQVHRRLLVWTERAQTRGMMIDVRVRVRPLALQRIRTRYARVTWNTCTVQNAFVVQNTNTRHGYSTVLFAAARPPLRAVFSNSPYRVIPHFRCGTTRLGEVERSPMFDTPGDNGARLFSLDGSMVDTGD